MTISLKQNKKYTTLMIKENIMSDKKHNLKSILAALFIMLPLTACTQAPKEVNGQPVKVVDSMLLHPLAINTDKEQHLYFRFKRQPKPDDPYIISAVAILPDEYEILSTEEKEGFFLNDILIKEKRMSFELELIHYDKDGKATPVGLIPPGPLPTVFGRHRFEGVHVASTWHGIEEGYSGRVNGLAYIDRIREGGYYHLTIRSLDDYRDYPKMKLAVRVSYFAYK